MIYYDLNNTDFRRYNIIQTHVSEFIWMYVSYVIS